MVNQREPIACGECPVRDKSLLCSLKNSQLKKISATRVARHYDKKEVVHYQGNPSFGIFCIQSGLVKVFRTETSGKQYIVRLAWPGDVLGLPTLFTEIPYLWTAKVVEPATICFLPRDSILNAAAEEKQMALKIIQTLSRFVEESEKRRVELTQGSVRERLARLLTHLSLHHGVRDKSGIRFNATLSRTEMAEMIGIRPETTMRALKEFREDRLLKINGTEIVLLDPPRLEKLASSTVFHTPCGHKTTS